MGPPSARISQALKVSPVHANLWFIKSTHQSLSDAHLDVFCHQKQLCGESSWETEANPNIRAQLRVLEMKMATLGERHEGTRTTLGKLGGLFREAGRLKVNKSTGTGYGDAQRGYRSVFCRTMPFIASSSCFGECSFADKTTEGR